jgi:uncharacterized repeat protein (TIGR01451 family)
MALLFASAAIVALCSCRAPIGKSASRRAIEQMPAVLDAPPSPAPLPAATYDAAQVNYESPAPPLTLPPSAFTGGADATCGCGPYPVPWMPDGLAGPWPADEYICDGGDRGVEVSVLADWTVRNLDITDTVAHYDTLRGETVVEPSNRICIYAPRFAAVRTVKGLNAYQLNDGPVAAQDRAVPNANKETVFAASNTLRVQPRGQFGLKPTTIYRGRNMGVPLEGIEVPAALVSGFSPHEDFSIIKLGVTNLEEKARLASSVDAAIAWTGAESVSVVFDGKLPVESVTNVADVAAEQIYRYDLLGKPRLRIVKTASKQNARPGEIVDFTLRFDNIGDQTIGNVTIIDNLTTRLEYVDGSVQSSVGANFVTHDNEADSLVLRWEVTDPLKVGDGGIIRFKARVR